MRSSLWKYGLEFQTWNEASSMILTKPSSNCRYAGPADLQRLQACSSVPQGSHRRLLPRLQHFHRRQPVRCSHLKPSVPCGSRVRSCNVDVIAGFSSHSKKPSNQPTNDALFLQDRTCLNSSAAAASPCSCTTAAPPTFAARTAAGSTRQDQVKPPHCHPSKNHHLAGLELMMQIVTN